MNAIWLAWGDRYIKEAAISAQSIKAQMSAITTCLFTSSGFQEGFDRVGTVSSRHGDWYTTLVQWCHESLALIPDDEKVLYLDTDTYIISPVWELGDMLEKYDILGVHAPARFTQPHQPMPIKIPDAFPELNIGMLAYRNNDRIKKLFSDWAQKQGSGKYGNNDQRSLRAALWESDARLYIVAPEYNFRFGFGGFLGRRAKILHGRSENWQALAERLTQPCCMATWQRGELT